MIVIGWILYGAIVGLVAWLITPPRSARPGEIVVTILLGIAGALLGSWLGLLVGLYSSPEAGGAASFTLALLGAIGILAVYVRFIREQ